MVELQKTNEELVRAKNAAEAANRAKSEFLASMSHEIRTPMNAVLGFAELLDSMIHDPRQKTYLQAIRSGGKNLLTLINDILDLSKIEARKMELHYEPVSIAAIFKEIHDVFALKVSEKGLDFIAEIDEGVPSSLLLDEVRLRQIIFNLIGNAVKFTDKGYIRLKAELGNPRPDSDVELRLIVEDTGIGIPSDSIQTVFEAFRQQDGQDTRKYGGTGLGLTITKRLTEMMGGEITVQSETGKGSRFEILFHQISPASTPPKAQQECIEIKDVIFEPATILIVDDIETNRSLVRAYFQNTNIRFIEAENGQKALILAKHWHPDVILMDLRMPVMDGREAARRISADPEIAQIPVIALTASGMKDEKEQSLSDGFSGYLIKPVQKADLYNELMKFLKHSKTTEPCEPEQPSLKEIEIEKPSDIPEQTLKKLPEIIFQLETEFMPFWESARKNGFFNEIEEFGKKLQRTGQQFSVPMLQAYGETLMLQVSSFDIENIDKTLDAYPNLIERVRSLAG